MATLAAIATPLLCAVGASSTFTPPPGVVPSYLTPRLHWSTSHYRSQGDPTGPIKLGSTWHMFTDCGKGWCHAISVDGAVSWNETRPVSLDNGTGIGTGSWSVLPNGTAVGLYCAGGSGCRSLECIGVMTSDDRRLERITDHGVKLRMPRNLSGFRDPARPFLSKDKSRMCAVLGGGADDCSEGGNKWLLYCTPDLIRVDEWQYVSTLASEFARPYAPSGGESSAGLNSGCTGLVSCPDFFPLSTGPRDKDVWMLIGSYNTARSAWYPPSRWSIGAFDGTTFSATSSGILGGDSDYVPKTGADETNAGRRFLWSNIGGTPGYHSGYLSLSRELSLSISAIATELETKFIPELASLRKPQSDDGWSAAPTSAIAQGTEQTMLRVGDTSLHPAPGSHQMEVRLRVPGATVAVAGSDTFGIAVMSSVNDLATSFRETTRIGYSPFLKQITIDRHMSSAMSQGWPVATGRAIGTPTADATVSYPLYVPRGADLELHVIVDGFLLEVCANNKTIIAAMALPSQANSTRVGVFGLRVAADVSLEAWDLRPIY